MSQHPSPLNILIPDDPEVKGQYLALGWIEAQPTAWAPASLKWPPGRGAPLHPEDGLIAAATSRGIDELLGWKLMGQLIGKLPDPTTHEGEFVEMKVEVSMCFRRRAVRSPRKGFPTLQSWETLNARIEVPREG